MQATTGGSRGVRQRDATRCLVEAETEIDEELSARDICRYVEGRNLSKTTAAIVACRKCDCSPRGGNDSGRSGIARSAGPSATRPRQVSEPGSACRRGDEMAEA